MFESVTSLVWVRCKTDFAHTTRKPKANVDRCKSKMRGKSNAFNSNLQKNWSQNPQGFWFFNSTYTKKQILPTIFLISYVCIFLNMHSKVLVYSTIQILHVTYLCSILVKVLSSFEIILKKYMFQKENINVNIFILFLKILLLDLSRVTSFIR